MVRSAPRLPIPLIAVSLLHIGCASRVIVERGVKARMRDGAALIADIYRPAAAGRFPVLLMRTPYCNHTPDRGYTPMVEHGYVVIVQQVRGRCGSEGEWYPFAHEAADGYDTVEWAAALPYSTGKVGMFGGSYPGATQMFAAVAAPEHLAAIFPITTASDFHDGWVYQGGAFEQWLDESWPSHALADNGPAHRWYDGLPLLGRVAPYLPESNPVDMKRIWTLPLDSYPEQDAKSGAAFARYFRDWLAHPDDDEYWKRWSFEEQYRKINVPGFHVGGWYDVFLSGTIRNFAGMRTQGNEAARRGQKLLIGPWTHSGVYARKNGELDFGEASVVPQNDQLLFRWYDHWLEGIKNGVEQEKPVRIFVMGKNTWRDEDSWPPAGAETVRYYLHSGSHAAGLNGDGALSDSAPQSEPADQFVYDPANPVPSVGGPLCCDESQFASGPRDQRPIERRKDVLVFTTAPFTEDFEATGSVSVELYGSSSAADTDFTAKLVDVWPNGFAQNLTEGIIRARYSDNPEKPAQMVPNQISRFTIDLWSTSNDFLPGHRLRLEISSSNFPRFDRNLNTGGDQGRWAGMVKATNAVLHDAKHPSALVLSVMPRNRHAEAATQSRPIDKGAHAD